MYSQTLLSVSEHLLDIPNSAIIDLLQSRGANVPSDLPLSRVSHRFTASLVLLLCEQHMFVVLELDKLPSNDYRGTFAG